MWARGGYEELKNSGEELYRTWSFGTKRRR
jgi:hypothetical protein